MDKYYCTVCDQECSFTEVDEGIGAYEYWGSKEIDSKIVAYSDCCNDNVKRQEVV